MMVKSTCFRPFSHLVRRGVGCLALLGLLATTAQASTTINQQFSPATIDPGDVSRYTISIANTSTVALTNAAVTVLLPANITISNPANVSNACGFTVNAATAGTSKVHLTAGTIPAGTGIVDGTCTFQVDVTSIVAGNHVSTIPASTSPDSTTAGYTAIENVTQIWNLTPANATLAVNTLQNPTGSKSFSPSPAKAGDPVTLTVVLSNPNGATTIPITTFTDTLPTDGAGHDMLIASPASPTINCTGTSAANGTVTATPGASSFTLTGGAIGKGGSCTITVKVKVATINGASQSFTNTLASGAIGNPRGLTSPTFQQSLTVNTPIGVSKTFNPTLIPTGQLSLLTITISNTSTANTLPITSFVDDFTAINLSIVNTANGAASNPAVACTGSGFNNGTLTDHNDVALTQGSTGVKLVNAIAGPGGSCVITAYVTTAVDGAHVNTIPVNAITNPSNHASPTASATLTGNAQLTVAKTVSVGNVAPGQWTEFTVVISNYSGGAVTAVNMTDVMPAPSGHQMTMFDPGSGFYSTDAGCTGGTWTGTNAAGTSTGSAPTAADAGIRWAGGTVVAGSGASPGVCTIKLRAKVPAAAPVATTFTNSFAVNDITGTGGSGGVGNVNTSSVDVASIASGAITKAFSPVAIAQGGQSTLTITIYNRTVSALTTVSLTDNLPSGITLAANPAATNSCGGTLLAAPGGGQIVLTNGTVAARPVASQESTCVITAKVTGSVVGTYTNNILTGNFSNTEGVTIPATVSANLDVTTGITGSKSFAPTAVTSGGFSRAKVTVTNSSNGALTNLAIDDDTMSAGLVVANPANASSSCSGSPSIVAVPGTGRAQLLGFSLSAGVSCDFSFDVVTSGSGPWTNTIPIGKITSAQGPSNTAAITGTLNAVPATISLNKSFSPVLVTGGVASVLQIDLSNPSAGTINGVSFTDTFPTGIEVYPVPNASTDCPGGVVSAVPGDNKFTLTGATSPASTTCHVYVTTTSVKFLNLTNTIPIGAMTSNQGYTNPASTSATLSTLQGLGIMKGFSPAYIGPGQTSRLKMRLVSTFDPFALVPTLLTGVSYTDTLPSGLVVANPANGTTDCGGGIVSAAPGATLVTISSANIPAGTNCRFEVDVTAAALGAYNNTIPANAVTSNEGVTNNSAANATLYVVNSPTISKAFANAIRNPGQANTLTVTVSNSSGTTITGVQLTDNLPNGLVVAATPNAATTCTNGAVTANSSSTFVKLSGASINTGSSCTFSVDVVGSTPGTYINNVPASALVTNEALTNPGAANASMQILNPVSVTKAFAPVSIALAGTSTLTITLTNGNASATTLTTALVDVLPTNVVIATTPNVAKTCPGTVTATAGASTITYANGASIPAGSCTISVDVTSGVGGTYTNTLAAGQLQTAAGNNQTPAVASLAVGATALVPPTVTKSFSPTTINAGQTSTLTINLGNANAGALTLNALFSDTLPSNVVVAAGPVVGGTCGGTVTAAAGGSTITYANGATIPAGGCTITVAVTSSVTGSYTNTIAAGGISVNDGGAGSLSNVLPATAGLVVVTIQPPSVTKSFSINTINPGGLTRLTLSLGNVNGSALVLTSAFTDTLPANVTVASVPNIGGSCNAGSITATAGASTITFANGATIPSGGCTIQVDLTSATPGTYVNTIAANSLVTGALSNAAAATATLFVNVLQPPSISKSFSPTLIGLNGVSSLNLSLANPNAVLVTLSADMVDTLPSGVVIATPANIRTSSGCDASTSGKVVAVAGANTVTFQSGGKIPANGGCTIAVDVTSAAVAAYTNTIAANALQTNAGNNPVSTTATLTVYALPTISKAFAPTTILAGASSTLTITLGNTNAGAVTLSSALVDTLPAGLVLASPATIGGTCIATNPGKVTAVAGTGSVTYASGATIPAAGCTITVPVTSAGGGVFVNTIPAAGLKTNGGNNANPTSATLTVLGPPSVSKAFSPSSTTIGGTASLTITLNNGNATAATLTANLVDTLPGNVSVVPGSATGTCTIGSVVLTSSTITYPTGASIPSGGCTISVNVTVGASGSFVNTIAAGALQTNAGNNPSPTSSTITANSSLPPIVTPPTISGQPVYGALGGRVFLDLNNNGLFDTADSGIASVSLVLSGFSFGVNGIDDNGAGDDLAITPQTQTTDISGYYLFTNLLPGRYTVTEPQQPANTSNGLTMAGQAGGVVTAVGTTPSVITAVRVVGTSVLNNDFAEIPGLNTISGLVFLDVNRNGVYDGGDQPLSGVALTLSGYTLGSNGRDDGGQGDDVVISPQSQFTDIGGKYLFGGLANGRYTVTEPTQPTGTSNGVTLAGSLGGTATATTVVPSVISSIVLQANSSLNNNFGEVALAGSLSGKVFLDANNDGVFNGSDQPLEKVTLTLTGYTLGANGVDDKGLGDDAAITAKSTLTDASGNYLFIGLAAGVYTVTEPTQPSNTRNGLTIPGSTGGTVTPATNTPSVIAAIPLAANQASVANNFAEILPVGQISGKVYLDINNNGAFDGTDRPISGVTVTLSGYTFGANNQDDGGKVDDIAPAPVSKSTDSNGNYLFDNLNPGRYTVTEPTQPAGTFSGISVAGSTGGAATPVATLPSVISGIVINANSSIGNNFGEITDALGSIAGKVYLDDNNNGVPENTETPLSGITVTLSGYQFGANGIDNGGQGDDSVIAAQSLLTDGSGRYLFDLLKAGNYTVTEPTQPNGTRNGITTPGSTGGSATAAATTPSSISGIVINNNASIENNFGEISVPGTGAIYGKVYFDPNNNGLIDNFEPGISNVKVTLSGYTYGPNGIDDKGQGDDIVGSTDQVTDGDGAYGFTALPPGRYAVTVPTVPPNVIAGITTAGSKGGTTTTAGVPPASISGIVIQNDVSVSNNFGHVPTKTTELKITKTVDNPRPVVSTVVTFTINVVNNGPENTDGVKINEKMPDGYTTLSVAATQGTFSAATGVWEVGSVKVGEKATLVITARVNPTGSYTNIASVVGSSVFNIALSNNSLSTSSTSTTPAPDGLTPPPLHSVPFLSPLGHLLLIVLVGVAGFVARRGRSD